VTGIVDLVGDHDHRCLAATKQQGDPLVLRGHANRCIDDEYHHLSGLHRLLGLSADLVVEGVTIGNPAPGVDQREVVALPFPIDGLSISSDAGALLNDRFATPNNPIHQRGFAHVWTTDDGDDR
jgi:hypothetical protein